MTFALSYPPLEYKTLPKSRFYRKNAESDMERLWSLILPDPKHIYNTRVALPRQNHIEKCAAIFYGGQRAGKTEALIWYGSELKRRWPYPMYVQSSDNPQELLDNLHPYFDSQYIFVDDFTNQFAAMKPEDRRQLSKNWFRQAHYLKDAINRPYGTFFSAIGVHRGGKSIDTTFKSDSDLIVIKKLIGTDNEGKGDYDFQQMRLLFGKDGIKFMKRVQNDRVKTRDPAYRGWGLWRYENQVGVWYNPVAPRNFQIFTPGEITERWYEKPNGNISRISLLNRYGLRYISDDVEPGPTQPIGTKIKFKLLEETQADYLVNKIKILGLQKSENDKGPTYWAEYVRVGTLQEVQRIYKENTPQNVRYHINQFKQRLIGEITEEVIRDEFYPLYKIIAGNKNPDLANHEDPEKATHFVEVKNWDDLTKAPKDGMTNQSDNSLPTLAREAIFSGKKEVSLIAFQYGMRNQEPYSCVRRYEVFLE